MIIQHTISSKSLLFVKALCVIGLIILLAFIFLFRFYNYQNVFYQNSDNARDYLVAQHTVEFKEFTTIYPDNSGSEISASSGQKLTNCFLYFYVLMVFYSLTRSPELFHALFCLSSTFTLLIYGYKFFSLLLTYITPSTTKNSSLFFKRRNNFLLKLYEKRWAILGTIALCSMPFLIIMNQTIYQPHFIPPLLMASLFYLLHGYTQSNKRDLVFSNSILGITLIFHFSTLPLFPIYFILNFFVMRKIIDQNYSNIKWKRKLLLIFISWPMIALYITCAFFIFNQLYTHGFVKGIQNYQEFFYAIFNGKNLNPTHYWQQLRYNFPIFFYNFTKSSWFSFMKNTSFYNYLFWFFSFCSIFLAGLFSSKKTHSILKAEALLCGSFFLIFLLPKDSELFPVFYYAPYYVIVMVFIISCVFSITARHHHLALFFLGMILSILFFNNLITILQSKSYRSVYSTYQVSSDSIIQDIKNNNISLQDFSLYSLAGTFHWSDTSFWGNLEMAFHTKLIRLVPGFINIEPLSDDVHYLYVICDDPHILLSQLGDQPQTLCLEYFQLHPNLQDTELLLNDKQKNLRVYRLYFQPAVTVSRLNFYDYPTVSF